MERKSKSATKRYAHEHEFTELHSCVRSAHLSLQAWNPFCPQISMRMGLIYSLKTRFENFSLTQNKSVIKIVHKV